MGLRDIFIEAGVPIARPDDFHFRQGWLNLPCFFCNSSKKLLGITEDGRRASCYQCGRKSPSSVLFAALGKNPEAFRYAREQIKYIAPPRQEAVQKAYGKYTPPLGLMPLSAKDRSYLNSRGLDANRLEADYGLQSIGPFSGLPKGIFIPITYQGSPVSWQVRFREPVNNQRYKTASDEQKSMSEKEILFGSDRCSNAIIITEGFFDMANIGFGAVCTFGLAYTQIQLQLMARFSRRIICFDNSIAAQQVATRLAGDLAAFPGETLQVCLKADDPGSASRSEVDELRKFAGLPCL